MTLARRAAGLALLTALIAGCGAASANHAPVAAHTSASPVPTATPLATTPVKAQVPTTPAARHHHRAPAPAVTTPPAPPASMNPIPQDNGGDHDADNNGGPSDGDGNVWRSPAGHQYDGQPGTPAASAPARTPSGRPGRAAACPGPAFLASRPRDGSGAGGREQIR